MGLSVVCSSSSRALWETCAGRFLDELGTHTGPSGWSSWAWLAHRVQRDALLEAAAERGLPGWLEPPISFLSELRGLFEIEERPVGILTGRLLVARLAAEAADEAGLSAAARERGPARAHMIDGVFSELLPEGVPPETLGRALRELGGDAFARRRNGWVAAAYAALRARLREEGRYDPRQIHALVAERIEAGGLSRALGGAGRLHIYGVTTLRARRRLFAALAAEERVETSVYLPDGEQLPEWEEVAGGPAERVERRGPLPRLEVQPAPDAVREAAWVARQVKGVLARGEAAPHEVAVVARSGREDTRRLHAALAAAGVPATARIRTILAEVPALNALLGLLGAEATGWPYRSLRQVVASPYFEIGIDVRAIDFLATERRLSGLEAWEGALRELRTRTEADRRGALRGSGIHGDRVEKDLAHFAALRGGVGRLGGSRPEAEWIDLTREILAGRLFRFRRRLCREAAERWDVVRIDQRGVVALEALLVEWRELLRNAPSGGGEALGAREWHRRLRRLLEANEIALSTPLQTGVQVLEAHEAALTPFRRLFVVHANDGVFPRAGRTGGVFSDAERARLARLGIPLSSREDALRRERELWRAVTAGEDVTITYRTTDAAGVPRLPSLMVPPHQPERELPRTLDAGAAAEAERPGTAPKPVSRAELLARETARLGRLRRSGDPAPFLTPRPGLLRRVVLGAFADELRSGELDGLVHCERELAVPEVTRRATAATPESVLALDRPISERPTPWNGHLRDPAVLEVLAERLGEGRVWSASQLEQYGRRPFDFLIERVLHVGEVEEVEEETSPLAFGSVAHALLQRFYERVKDDPPSAIDGRAQAALREAAEQTFAEFEGGGMWLGLPTLWAVHRADVEQRVWEYLAWELPYLAEKGARPALVEHRFGDEGAGDPVRLEGAAAGGGRGALLLRGRIDRVDRYPGPAGPSLQVIDYKSSSIPSRKGYEDGALLQTALYMRALSLTGYGPVKRGAYRAIRRPGDPKNGAELRAAQVDSVLRFALAIPARARAGLFEAVQAGSTRLEEWQTGREVTRTEARVTTGSRFDRVSG